MVMPNNVGYVAECQEDRALVRDEETDRLVPGEYVQRFKLKLKNTLGQEMVVWAVLEDKSVTEDVTQFFSAELTTVLLSNRTVTELAQQLKADLSDKKGVHDEAIACLEAHPAHAQLLERLEVHLKKRIDEYLASQSG